MNVPFFLFAVFHFVQLRITAPDIHVRFYLVIAPSDALDTSLQYFAITPTE